MATQSNFSKKLNDYKRCMRVLDCANYIYLDEIKKFEFHKISKYSKSRCIFNRTVKDFALVKDLLDKGEIINSAVLLRNVFENLMYIFATSIKKNMVVNLDINPVIFRNTVENNCSELFTDYFEKDDFNMIYKYLCKIVHPCSLKELLSYFEKTIKYRMYLVNNLKYILVTLEYMFLNFLNKRLGMFNEMDKGLIDVCTYANLYNINDFILNIDKTQRFIKQYGYYDTDNKYVKESNELFVSLYNEMSSNKESIEIDLTNLLKEVDKQIYANGYTEIVSDILNNRKK